MLAGQLAAAADAGLAVGMPKLCFRDVDRKVQLAAADQCSVVALQLYMNRRAGPSFRAWSAGSFASGDLVCRGLRGRPVRAAPPV